MNYPFDQNLELLKQVFKPEQVEIKQERLREIYTKTEKDWKKHTIDLGLKKVKYLLICEAPPWSENIDPTYFYSQVQKGFPTKIWNAIYPNRTKSTGIQFYQDLADAGFLLVDNTPYAMKYNTPDRIKSGYSAILEDYLPHLISKIENNFEIHGDLKIAFGFKKNAHAFMEVTNGELMLHGKNYSFNHHNIAVDGSGFTNPKMLREIFDIA